jgi:tRNA-splicing ligase RtcB (3'-phosphate/5'-hydroxy nucleic acid ligase)
MERFSRRIQVEISLDESDRVWVVLHSGSRGIGNKLAMRHIKTAQKIMDENLVQLKDRDLAYLTEGRKEFSDYITDLLWAQDFALLNREEMMDRVMIELSYLFYKEDGHQAEIECVFRSIRPAIPGETGRHCGAKRPGVVGAKRRWSFFS